MNWTTLLILAGVVAVVLMARNSGRISVRAAATHLRQGALLIDVRSPAEFSSGHLDGALNLPLDEIETALPKRAPDKSQVLLLHCASGLRSGLAKGKLTALGYTNTFNLGSYGRARVIVREAGGITSPR